MKMAKAKKAGKKGNFKKTTKKVLKITAGVLVGALALAGTVSIAKNVSDKYSKDTYVFTEKYYTTDGYIDDYGVYLSFDNTSQTNYAVQLTSVDYYKMNELKSIEYEVNKDYPLGGFQINLFDETKTLIAIHDTELTEEKVKEYIEEQGAVWFRVEIMPKNDADGKIDKSEMKKCVEQVVVTMWNEAPEAESEVPENSENADA